jgi:hypothetical protein
MSSPPFSPLLSFVPTKFVYYTHSEWAGGTEGSSGPCGAGVNCPFLWDVTLILLADIVSMFC